MRTNWPLRVVVAVGLLASLIATLVGLGAGPAPTIRLIYLLVAGSWLIVAQLVLERLPGHAIGRIMLGFGGLMAFYLFWDAVVALLAGDPAAAVVAWVISLLDGPFFLLVALLFLVFPTGSPPSPRWRFLVWLDVIACAGVALGSAFRPGPFAYYAGITNPFAIRDFPANAIWEPAYLLLIGSVALSALSLISRWRRGGPFERAQLKWAAAAAGLVAMAMGGYAFLVGPGKFNDVADLIMVVAFGFFPIAIGIAILRYRLFEIDRLISRTIAYLTVTGVLVATYASAILLLQGPLGAITGGDVVPVAISTLVAAALFQPLRRWVQSAVDLRFDRARFDAERTTAAFSERLRDEVDIETVTADLDATVQSALKPATLGLWLRPGPNR